MLRTCTLVTKPISIAESNRFSPSGKILRTAPIRYITYSIQRHGLSYTTFAYEAISVPSLSVTTPADTVQVSVKVTNTGKRVGSEVIQVYISLPKGNLTHPQNQLRGFAKVKDLAPGFTATVDINLDRYAMSYWDDINNCWTVDKGTYTLKVGGSSDKLPLETTFEVLKGYEWNGV